MPSRPPLFYARPRQPRSEVNAAADDRRGSAHERGYTAQWDRASALFRLHHPLCLGCEAIGLVRATEVTDHVVPHKGDRAAFWNRDLWQPACKWHHDQVKQRLEARYGKGELLISDLWLNSSAAIEVALELLPSLEGGGRKV